MRKGYHTIPGSDYLTAKMPGNSAGNPFYHKLDLTALGYIKVVINSFWLVPLRLIIIAAILIVGVIMSSIAAVRDPNTPLRGWRKYLIHNIGLKMNRVLLFAMGFHRIRTHGTPASSEVAPIRVVAPHSSFFDVVLCCLDIVPSFVAKASERNTPIFGRLVDQTLKAIFVTRTDVNSRQQCYNEILRRVESEDEWPTVLIFPEGTITNREQIIYFKQGAFKPGVPVQPVYIRYNNNKNVNVWAERGPSVLLTIYLTICQFNNSVDIEYLPVYTPSDIERDNPCLFAENVRTLLSETAGVPLTSHTYEDILLGYEAKCLGLPFAVGVIEYAQVAKPYNANLDQMKTMLNRFAKIDTNRDGLISEDDLVLFMKVPKDDNFVVFFEMLDVNKRGFITFGEYAEGLLKHSKPLLESEVHLQSIFNYFDRDSDNVLSTDDLSWLPKQSPDDEDVVIDYRTSSCCCSRNRSSHQRTRDIERGERREITAGPWDFCQFKELIKDNLDFLLFFHQSQNGGLLLPMANGSINSHMVTVVRE